MFTINLSFRAIQLEYFKTAYHNWVGEYEGASVSEGLGMAASQFRREMKAAGKASPVGSLVRMARQARKESKTQDRSIKDRLSLGNFYKYRSANVQVKKHDDSYRESFASLNNPILVPVLERKNKKQFCNALLRRV